MDIWAIEKQHPTDITGGFNGSTQHKLKVYLTEFKGLNRFATADSEKTLSCSGPIEGSLGRRFFAKSIMGSTD